MHVDRAIFIALLVSLLMSSGMICGGTPTVTILSPAHGSFATSTNMTISGEVQNVNLGNASLTLNGIPIPLTSNSWSIELPLDTAEIFNPFLAEMVVAGSTRKYRDRVVVVAGESVTDGLFSPQSVALRLNDRGLDSLEGLLAEIAGAGLDIGALLPAGTLLIEDFCAIDGGFLGCLGSVDVRIANPPPSFSGFLVDMDSMSGFAAGDVTINDIRVDIDIDGSGIAPSCGLRVTASQTDILSDLSLEPDATNPETIDIDQIGNVNVVFQNFNDQFTSGLCDFPVIGDLIQLIIGDIEGPVRNALQDFLNDPDGAGPQDGPIADALESALAGISIGGALGETVGVTLEVPFFSVAEDTTGITLGSDARATRIIGSGPGECLPPAGAPDLAASLQFVEPFPSFGATTPVGGAPYGFGVGLSASALNQLLKAVVECGLLNLSLAELDIGGGPAPLTAGFLTFLVPEFAGFDPALPMRIDIRPTLAPIVTDGPGAGGEVAELRIAQLALDIVDANAGVVYLSLMADARLGLNVSVDPGAGELVFGLGTPTAEDFSVVFLKNAINADPEFLELALPFFLAPVLTDLAGSLTSIPLPEILGLQLDVLEVTRQGSFISIFADLVPVTP